MNTGASQVEVAVAESRLLGVVLFACARERKRAGFGLDFDLLRVDLDLARLPPDDPETYAMIRRAETVGTFQI